MARNRNTLGFDLFALLLGLILAAAFTLAVIATVRDCQHRNASENIR
jgi:hypothetical protein